MFNFYLHKVQGNAQDDTQSLANLTNREVSLEKDTRQKFLYWIGLSLSHVLKKYQYHCPSLWSLIYC